MTSLHKLCCHTIVHAKTVYEIDKLPLPNRIKAYFQSY